jgi:glycosyltransferase involved in cell wall biosynthesis
VNQQHILHVLGPAQPEGTGVARLVSAIAHGVDPSRFKVHAWFLGSDGPLAAELEKQGVAVRVVAWSGGLPDLPGMLRFAMQLRKQKFAIVHQHYGGRALRWIVCLNQGSRILAHLHGRILENRGIELADYKLQAVDFAIATSPSVAKRVKTVPVEVVYPGVPMSRFQAERHSQPTRDGYIVGTAARLVALKGIIYLIQAVSLLRSKFSNVRLEIAGSGPEESALREEVKKLGLADCVKFLTWQTDIAPTLARWDVFVLPSIEDASPIAVIEAMAAGLPVIATNVGGVPDIVEDGKTGLLVPPADPVALAESLARLLGDPGERQQFGLAGRARAREKFSQESMVSAVAAIYDRLLAGGSCA